jgi:PAS domain S-box-containing protein
MTPQWSWCAPRKVHMISPDRGGQIWPGSLVLPGQLADYCVDMTTVCSPQGEYLYVSAAAEPMLGWQPSDLIGLCADEFIHPEDVAAAQLARAAALRTPAVVVTTQRFRGQDGGYLWTESVQRHVSGPDPRTPVLIASIRDIADRKLVESRMERRALTDPLTGIANRSLAIDRLARALLRLERHHSVVAVISLDLDRFKGINDSLGQSWGTCSS